MPKQDRQQTLLFFSVAVIIFLFLIGLVSYFRFKQDVATLSQRSNATVTVTPGVSQDTPDDKAIDDLLNSVDKDLKASGSDLNEKPTPLQ